MKRFLILLLLIFFIISCNNKKGYTDPGTIDTTQTIDPDTIKNNPPDPPKPKPRIKTVREKLLDSLENQLNVRETSPNRGPMVDIYQRTVNTSLGVAWCGAFVGSNLFWQNIQNPKSAWSPDYAKTKDIIWTPKTKNYVELDTCDVLTFYYSNLGRVGHVGFYIYTDSEGFFITIEGNTNGAGSREGDGVYKKKRDPDKVYAISRYIK